ncbi:MAG: hypothetical protein Q7W45_08675 [Bacteroidota bacterium]|jgi:hypothetical protein|nr:hypothetical protein [Bacteroidota bacterium]MDP3144248.1 hypothetical protein [Bacteroidota bacterium]
MNVSQRVCIYPKDVMRITGKSERYSRRLLTKIKKQLNKSSHQFVTVSEFSDYTGIDKPTIVENLVD